MALPDPTRRYMLAFAALAPGLALPSVASAQTRAGSTLPADLDEALRAYHRATVANDTDTLGDLVTDDYLLVNSDSSIQDKPSYLDDFRVPGFRLDPYVMEQQFHRVWGDAAVTGGSMLLGWTLNGRYESRRLRVVHAWARQNGRWRLAYSQLTRIPD